MLHRTALGYNKRVSAIGLLYCLQELIFLKMHSLNDVPTRVEHAANVFSVDSCCEMWIAEMPSVARLVGYSLKGRSRGEKIE